VLIFHVPAAIFCYVFFIVCIAVNIGIRAGKNVSPAIAIALCETGLLFAGITILTGSIWGYHAWGAAWVWEPRLTGMFLMTLFFLSWRLACAIAGPQITSKGQFTATLIILGLPAMVFTHLAVRLFGGIHPETMPTSAANLPTWQWGLITLLYLVIAAVFTPVRIKKIQLQFENDNT
jgi:heme exporter protein C